MEKVAQGKTRAGEARGKRRGRWQPAYWPTHADYAATGDVRVRFGVVVAGYLDSIMRGVAEHDLPFARSELQGLQRLIDAADARPDRNVQGWRGVLYGAVPKTDAARTSAATPASNVVSLDAARRRLQLQKETDDGE